MFKCQGCNKTSKKRTRMNRITVEQREKTYYNIIIKHPTVKKERFMQFERKDINVIKELERQGWKIVHENFSKGHEIVKEKILCEDCNNKLEEENAKSEK